MKTSHDILRQIQKRCDYVVTPAVTASSAYSAGNNVGGLITIDEGTSNRSPITEGDMSAILNDLVVLDKDAQNKALILYFFNDKPTTPTDKTAYAPTAADLLKCIGVVNVAAADYASVNSIGIAAASAQRNIGLVLKSNTSQTPATPTALYLVIATGTSGTPTWTTTSSVQIRLKFIYGN